MVLNCIFYRKGDNLMADISLRTDEIISRDLDDYGDMILRLAYSYMKKTH